MWTRYEEDREEGQPSRAVGQAKDYLARNGILVRPSP